MNLKEIWQNALVFLERDLSKGVIATFFGPAELAGLEEGTARILCPNRLAQEQLRSRYSSQLTEALRAATGSDYQLSFEIKPLKTELPANSGSEIQPSLFHHSPPNGLAVSYSFENFVVGPSNQLAVSVAQAVTEQPGMLHNPFFIYSGVGLGKTHLLHAIGNHIKEKKPDAHVIYASAERFTTEFIRSIQNRQTAASFRRKFRSVDALLIDDVQFFASRTASQEEFFNTFNELYLAGKQIILAGDRHPAEFRNVEQRLVSRFAGGMITDIQEPDLDMRLQILRRKAAAQEAQVSEEVLLALAQQLEGSIRQLEGALHQLLAIARAQKAPPTAELLNAVIKTAGPVRPFVTPAEVIKSVCQAYQITAEQLCSARRSKEIVLPRQVAAYLLRYINKASLNQIGKLLGGKDHTTILYGLKKIDRQLAADEILRNQVESVRGEILGKNR
ncbi:MAG: chromosomal replication initiator protein DnaA [Patescibacteria group bacterium]